jgi:hypothetical protein
LFYVFPLRFFKHVEYTLILSCNHHLGSHFPEKTIDKLTEPFFMTWIFEYLQFACK